MIVEPILWFVLLDCICRLHFQAEYIVGAFGTQGTDE
jgi:hypothetical protein